ncbi:hypothetical protein AQUCO_01300390v1 [Aquilegia coerulea]|uniref:Uncharacterized protein n=1 Tax=Aquilegia coerulea TaxID=218851 RepID=A0A2G5E1H2_AQUCA|nr:hypothetical protein AQUCO_01300390v1 [Aquilegia coerulea]
MFHGHHMNHSNAMTINQPMRTLSSSNITIILLMDPPRAFRESGLQKIFYQSKSKSNSLGLYKLYSIHRVSWSGSNKYFINKYVQPR